MAVAAPTQSKRSTARFVPEAELPPRELLVLDYLRFYIAKSGYAPTFREIATTIGLASPSLAKFYLRKLNDRGYIRWTPGAHRAIFLTGKRRA